MNQMLQRLSVEKLHHDEVLAMMLAHIVDGADVWMIQRGSSPGLAPEPFACQQIVRKLLGQEFERDHSVQSGILGLVDHAHPAAAELLEHAIMGHDLVGQGVVMLSGRVCDVKPPGPRQLGWPAGIFAGEREEPRASAAASCAASAAHIPCSSGRPAQGEDTDADRAGCRALLRPAFIVEPRQPQ